MKKNELKIVEYFVVFDTAFNTKEKALSLLNGWEHKERVNKEFVVMNKEMKEPEEIDLANNDFPYYRNIKNAHEHIEDELLYN